MGGAGGLILINRLEGGAPMSLKEQHKFAFLIGLFFRCRAGDFAAEFTTQRMAWAAIRDQEIHSGLEPGETAVKSLF